MRIGEADEVEVTHMESPNATREFIAGLKTTSDISIPGLYVAGSATDVKIKTLHASGETIQIRFGDVGSTDNRIVFTGFVKNYTISRPVDGPRTFEIALKVNAEVVA
jgi:predicted secreted protein